MRFHRSGNIVVSDILHSVKIFEHGDTLLTTTAGNLSDIFKEGITKVTPLQSRFSQQSRYSGTVNVR